MVFLSGMAVQAGYGADRAFTKGFWQQAFHSSCMKNGAENFAVQVFAYMANTGDERFSPYQSTTTICPWLSLFGIYRG